MHTWELNDTLIKLQDSVDCNVIVMMFTCFVT